MHFQGRVLGKNGAVTWCWRLLEIRAPQGQSNQSESINMSVGTQSSRESCRDAVRRSEHALTQQPPSAREDV